MCVCVCLLFYAIDLAYPHKTHPSMCSSASHASMVQIAPVVLVVQQPGFQDYLIERKWWSYHQEWWQKPAMVMSPLKIMDFTSKDCDFNGFYQQNGDLAWFFWDFTRKDADFTSQSLEPTNESQGINQQNLNRPPTNSEVTKKDAELTTKNGGMLPRIRNMAL